MLPLMKRTSCLQVVWVEIPLCLLECKDSLGEIFYFCHMYYLNKSYDFFLFFFFFFSFFFFMNKKNFIENQHDSKLPLIRDGRKPR